MRCFAAAWPGWSTPSVPTALGDGRLVGVCGVGCGGPMTPGGDEVSPLNIPALAGLPAAAAAGGAHRAADLRRQRRQGAGPRRGLAWARPPASRDYIGMVVSTGVGGGIVLDGRLLDGARRQRRPHRPRDRRARRPPVRLRGPGLPRGRGVGHRHRRHHRAARRPRPARRSVGRVPAGSWGGRWRRSPTCSTCGWPSSPGRWPSASAIRSSPRPRPSSTPRPGSTFSRGARGPPGRPRRPGAAGRRGRRRVARRLGRRRQRSVR